MTPEEHRLLITLALIVAELNPGRSRQIEDDLNAMQAATHVDIHTSLSGATMRRTLERIRDSHVPDQPTDAAGDDTVWIMRHVSHLRRIAGEALALKASAALDTPDPRDIILAKMAEALRQLERHAALNAMDRLIEVVTGIVGWEKSPLFSKLLEDAREALAEYEAWSGAKGENEGG